jgi:hypothetical protein
MCSVFSQVPADLVTKPGEGLGIYSVGSSTIASIYSATATAAVADAKGDFDVAVPHLRTAIALEHSMGYTEPPRVILRLRPCLVRVLLAWGGHTLEALTEAKADLTEAPYNAWGLASWGAAKDARQKGALAGDAYTENRLGTLCALFDGSSHEL